MDYIRSCYKVNMRFRTGDPPQLVQWYFVKHDTPCFPDPHVFGSANWQSRMYGNDDLGEVGDARPWVNGAMPGRGMVAGDHSVACFHSFADAWLSGLAPDQHVGPFNSDGVPLCCLDGPPFDCLELPDLIATFEGETGCGSIAGVADLVRDDPGLCNWHGVQPTWLGDAELHLDYDGVDWTLGIDCFEGQPDIVFESFVEDPFEVVFSVTDTTACCSFAGTDTFTVTITEAP